MNEVSNVKELLQYQEQAIISRILLKNSGGSVTLFAFNQGEGLSEHTAPFDAMVYVIEGETEIEISQQKFDLKEGETIILPANKPHSVKALKNFKMLLVMIKGLTSKK